MKYFYLVFIGFCINVVGAQTFDYQREWATYFGDGNVFFKDATVGKAGDVYIVGIVNYNPTGNFFTPSAGAHQTVYGGGVTDGFMVKFNKEGQLVWSTFFGGSGSDVVDGITIDAAGFIYIVGNTGSANGIASVESFQPELSGASDAFIAKFSELGEMIWSTYYGGLGDDDNNFSYGDPLVYSTTGITNDLSGNLYVYNITTSENMATVGVFQDNRYGSRSMLSKFDLDGQRIWATYYGNRWSEIFGVAVNANGLYVVGRDSTGSNTTEQSGYHATAGAHLMHSVGYDCAYLSKFDFEGQRLWSTYYGSDVDITWALAHPVKCYGDAVYLAGFTNGNGGIATTGAFQETIVEDGGFVPFLVKFNQAGVRQWGTYFGTNRPHQSFDSLCASLNIDTSGNVYLSGATALRDNIATPGSYQEHIAEEFFNLDNFVVKFNPQGERIWGTYYGGIKKEYNIITRFDQSGNMFFLGDTASEQNIATDGSYQTELFNHINPLYGETEPYNIYLAKFIPRVLETNDFTNNNLHIYPNPNNGNFSIAIKEPNCNVEVVNALGQTVLQQQMPNNQNIQINGLASGLYFVKVKSGNVTFKTEKILVR